MDADPEPTGASGPGDGPGDGLAERLSRARAFLVYLARRFEADHCARAAAALAYTSLLALVPLLTVLFITLSAFPAFQEWREAVEGFIFRNFVPALGDQVRGYLVQFADNARGLQAAGVAVLLLTVLAMMSTIESTFNVIWGIRRRRPLLVRFLVYWSVLTLGPVLIGAGMVASSYVISLPLLTDAGIDGTMRMRLIAAVPYVASTMAFVLFFKLIPYRPVPLKHALAGGLVASALFELAKKGFALYVTSFPAQQAIYGAFATIPIFLIWIYLSWVIVLLGAEITQCLTTFRAERPGRRGVLATTDPLYGAYRVLLRLSEAQRRGVGLAEKDLLAREADFGYDAVNATLERLDRAGWITRNESFQWILTRDLHLLTLLDLLRIAPSFAPPENVYAMTSDAADERLGACVRRLDAWSGEALDVPLATLIAGTDDAGEGAARGREAS